MKRPVVALTIAALCASASAQASVHAYIWVRGPSEVLRANTTYTLEVWGRIESSIFVDNISAMAGFGIDVLNTGGGASIASVSNVDIADWAEQFGYIGGIVGNDVVGVSGGQIAWLWWVDPRYPPDTRNPIPLFSFEITTAGGAPEQVSFAPANPNPNGGLSFYPLMTDGASIIAPNDVDTSLTLVPWVSRVPSPGAVEMLLPAGLGALVRRCR